MNNTDNINTNTNNNIKSANPANIRIFWDVDDVILNTSFVVVKNITHFFPIFLKNHVNLRYFLTPSGEPDISKYISTTIEATEVTEATESEGAESIIILRPKIQESAISELTKLKDALSFSVMMLQEYEASHAEYDEFGRVLTISHNSPEDEKMYDSACRKIERHNFKYQLLLSELNSIVSFTECFYGSLNEEICCVDHLKRKKWDFSDLFKDSCDTDGVEGGGRSTKSTYDNTEVLHRLVRDKDGKKIDEYDDIEVVNIKFKPTSKDSSDIFRSDIFWNMVTGNEDFKEGYNDLAGDASSGHFEHLRISNYFVTYGYPDSHIKKFNKLMDFLVGVGSHNVHDEETCASCTQLKLEQLKEINYYRNSYFACGKGATSNKALNEFFNGNTAEHKEDIDMSVESTGHTGLSGLSGLSIQIDDRLDNLINTNANIKILLKNMQETDSNGGICNRLNGNTLWDGYGVDNLYVANDIKDVFKLIRFFIENLEIYTNDKDI